MVKIAQNGHSPNFTLPSGETIAARLESMEMTSSELANLMGYPLWAIQTIIRDEAIIPPKTATLLEQSLGNSTNVRNKRGYGYQEFLAVNPVRPIRNEWNPDFMFPPGETVAETLEARGMTPAELADRMGYPLNTVNEIIKGDTAVTPEIATQLERVLGISASFWNSLESMYREWLAKNQAAPIAAGV